MGRPSISVVIPTCNRGMLLGRTLQSIAEQRWFPDELEVLVVDNGSGEDTPRVAQEWTSPIPRLRYVKEPSPGLHCARHRGLTETSGEILLYCDDDIRAFPTWLKGVADGFSDASVALVGGKDSPEFETSPPAWVERLWTPVAGGRMLGWYSLIELGEDAHDVDPGFVFGCNFAIRRKALLEAGGFHPDSVPRDLLRFRGDGETAVSEFIRSRGMRARYVPDASVHHWVSRSRMTWEYLYERSYAQGISDSFTVIRRDRRVKPRAALAAAFRQRVAITKLAIAAGRSDVLELLVRRGYSDGYLFHQREVVRDRRLLEWVLRPDYFNAAIV